MQKGTVRQNACIPGPKISSSPSVGVEEEGIGAPEASRGRWESIMSIRVFPDGASRIGAPMGISVQVIGGVRVRVGVLFVRAIVSGVLVMLVMANGCSCGGSRCMVVMVEEVG